ncbi:MAG: MBOAT family protein, partial [Treponemataceae bacterium]|nr:MBOAT family protein [Treponemataceae bacterium]
VYFVIPKKMRYIWLLAASYFFYMCWNAKYALLLLGSTIVTYGAARLIHYWKGKELLRKSMVVISLVLNFGILFLFKYLFVFC